MRNWFLVLILVGFLCQSALAQESTGVTPLAFQREGICGCNCNQRARSQQIQVEQSNSIMQNNSTSSQAQNQSIAPVIRINTGDPKSSQTDQVNNMYP